MKIISYANARMVALLRLEAFAPVRGLNERVFVEAVKDRYTFMRAPDLNLPREELQRTGLVFETGEIGEGAASVSLSKVSFHSDGIVVGATTTDQAEAFFNDLYRWLVRDNGFREVDFQKTYMSEVVVDFDKPVSRLIASYDQIVKIVMEGMSEASKAPITAALSGFDIDFRGDLNAHVPRFMLDRRIGSDFEQERFFCTAPLTSDGHIKALQAIEDLIQ